MVLGVSFDGIPANRAFAEKYAFPFRLLCDTSRTLGLAYGAADAADSAHARRISYLIGADGRIRAVWGKVDPKTHPADVLAKLG